MAMRYMARSTGFINECPQLERGARNGGEAWRSGFSDQCRGGMTFCIDTIDTVFLAKDHSRTRNVS